MRLGRDRTLVTAAALLVALAGCAQPPLACGEYPAGGGPAIVRTRDQQLCELVRQRVLQFLARSPDLTYEKAERLAGDARSWRRADTLDELVERIRTDAGDVLADLVTKAVASVEGPGGKPLPTACADIQRCLVDGAVKGAELGLAQRGWYLRGDRPDGDAVHPGVRGRIDLEDLTD